MGRRILTVEAYANQTGLTAAQIQYACRVGNLDAQKVATAGRGSWWIFEGAVITPKRRGRKLGSKNSR